MLNNGKMKHMSLDETIPTINNHPAFSYSNKGDLWVTLLEKAWAKKHGNFDCIEKGILEEPLHDFTAAPIRHFFLRSSNFNW